MKRLRLMIAADNSFAAQSVRLALRQTAGFQVIGFVDATDPVTNRVAELQPDIVVVDDTPEPGQSVKRMRELAQLLPEAKLVFLTLHMDNEALQAVFEAGATAAISKTVHPVSLATLLREISRDNVVHHPRRQVVPASGDCPLTDRELEILRLVAQGFTNARIARELFVTEQTVKFHLSNTYRKLGVANRTEASRYAHMHGLLDGQRPAARQPAATREGGASIKDADSAPGRARRQLRLPVFGEKVA
jgi:DNA-binding NarL/FixJ family response regulator